MARTASGDGGATACTSGFGQTPSPAVRQVRGTFDPTNGWGGYHHDGVPIFVLTRRQPDSSTRSWPLMSYVADVQTAMTQAKQAAGDKSVLVHGAGTAQLALAASVLDELEIHLIPVLPLQRPRGGLSVPIGHETPISGRVTTGGHVFLTSAGWTRRSVY